MIKKIVFFFFTLLAITSCDDDTFSTSPSHLLSFSADTIRFDTVFSSVPTPTKTFWVYNNNKEGLRCTSISLEQGNQSGYRVNVQGVYLGQENGYNTTNVEVRQHDSTRIFIEATLPNNYKQVPTSVSDNIVFQLESGVQQKVNLNAYAWDAEPIRHLVISNDTVFSNTGKPRIIYGKITINKGATLTITAGTTLYFHGDAGIDVYGRLVCEGEANDNVVLRGDRLDHMFDYLPYDRVSGQWQGLHLYETSYGNVLRHTDIHSSFNGISIDSADVSRSKLLLENSVVHNCQGYGIQATNASITLSNCQLSNTLNDCLYVDGGAVNINGCTLAQFYPFDSNRGNALNVTAVNHPLSQLECSNSLITGYGEDEVMLNFNQDDEERHFLFDHCLLRTPIVEGADSVKMVAVEYEKTGEEDKDNKYGLHNFILVDAEHQIYDFRLNKDAAAIGVANADTALPTDRLGRPRDGDPDAGCYEYVDNGDDKQQ